MRSLSLLLAAALSAATVGCSVHVPLPQSNASDVAAAWLRLIKEGQIDASYDALVPEIKEQFSAAEWKKMVDANAGVHGGIASFSVALVETDVPSTPLDDAEVAATIFYRDKTSQKASVLLLKQNGNWKPTGIETSGEPVAPTTPTR